MNDLNNSVNETAKPDISISYDQINENITVLKKVITTLRTSWNKDTKNSIEVLKESWVGKDCMEYIVKLLEMDKSVQNTILALELLCSTYEKAREMVLDNQSATSTAIRNI